MGGQILQLIMDLARERAGPVPSNLGTKRRLWTWSGFIYGGLIRVYLGGWFGLGHWNRHSLLQASLDEPAITKFKDCAGLLFSCSISIALQTLLNLVWPELSTAGTDRTKALRWQCTENSHVLFKQVTLVWGYRCHCQLIICHLKNLKCDALALVRLVVMKQPFPS